MLSNSAIRTSAVCSLLLVALTLAALGCDTAPPAAEQACSPAGSGASGARSTPWEYVGLGADTLFNVKVVGRHPERPDALLALTPPAPALEFDGYIFRSGDGGATWEAVVEGEAPYDLTFDPADPDVAYATGFGVLKSTDGGRTWAQLPSTGLPQGLMLWDVTVAPNTGEAGGPSTVYVAMEQTLVRSTDGGVTWENLVTSSCEDQAEAECRLRNGVTALAVDGLTVYAGTNFNGDLVVSHDGGDTWANSELVDLGLVVYDLLLDADNASVVYAAYPFERGSSSVGRVMRSEDGLAWSPYQEGLPERFAPRALAQDGATGDLYALGVNREEDDVRTSEVWRRARGAPSWEPVAQGPYDGSGALAVFEDERALYAGGEEGLWRLPLAGGTAVEPGPPCGG